jgi:hypothetical protein
MALLLPHCHPEQAVFAQRRIWASRAKRRVFCDAIIARLARFLIKLPPLERGRRTIPTLLQLRQFLGRDLRRFWAGIILLDLLVETLGIQRLVAGLVKFRQLQLRRYFAH